MKKIAVVLFIIQFAACPAVFALGQPINGVFAQALMDGEATAPIPSNSQIEVMIQQVKEATRDNSPLMIKATRLYKFKQQSRCGRIKFIIIQPTSGFILPGGQLNVCDDGAPPWRVCKNNPGELIPAHEYCADGSIPQDTQEVADAIKDALAHGELSQEQVAQKLKSPKGGAK